MKGLAPVFEQPPARCKVILLPYGEDSVMPLIQEILREEGYAASIPRSAAEAVYRIECSDNYYVLFANCFTLNTEAIEMFTMLREHPHVRSRVRNIGFSEAMSDRSARQWLSSGLIDDYLFIPFSLMELLWKVRRNAAVLTGG